MEISPFQKRITTFP